jgi:hypothetical protein
MAKRISTILGLFILLCSTAVRAQHIIDSVKIYDFPVREGVIYQYEPKTVYASFNAMPIISVVTKYDSLFHFEDGVITDIRKIDNFWAVSLENKKQEIVVYSNLQSTALKVGDQVKRGMYLGKMEKDYEDAMNQVDVLIFQKGKEIPYKKIMDYMRRYISSQAPKAYSL